MLKFSTLLYSPSYFISASWFLNFWKHAGGYEKKLAQFLFIVKATILKQQISKFYLQIQRIEASDHIYFGQQPIINVKAIFCA